MAHVDDSASYAYGMPEHRFSPRPWLLPAQDLSGAQMLCGMVVGYELAHRVGRCWHAPRQVYQACGSWGSVARCCVPPDGLPAEQVKHALGIAEYHAANLPDDGDIDNRLWSSTASNGPRAGISAAELARGFTGIPAFFFREYQEWGQDIGRNYLMVDGIAWKSEGMPVAGRTPVEGARRLVRDHGIALDDIAHIRVDGSRRTMRLGRLPPTTEGLNSIKPGSAAMLVDGESVWARCWNTVYQTHASKLPKVAVFGRGNGRSLSSVRAGDRMDDAPVW
jgi:2-methylcitrate dehydratase PrpD